MKILLMVVVSVIFGETGVVQKEQPAVQKEQPAVQKETQKVSTWQSIAENRAARMAARGYKGHLPNLPNCFEGVGWGGWNCGTCVGSGTLLADAQCMGVDGLVYRVRLWSGGGSAVRYRARLRGFRRRR